MAGKGIIEEFDVVEDTSRNIIKVIGVGGGGCNAVMNMYSEGIDSVTFAVCNTDSKSLAKCTVPVKIQLGESGLGAGANPDKGRQEAEHNIEDIKRLLNDGTKMVFVTAGMGGGTGTGAAPLVAGIAKGMGLLTIGIVTLPFYFEKRRKILKALKGLEEMRRNVDALLIINNEQISKIYNDSHISVNEAFGIADDILANAVKSISELITIDGKIATDFRDVESTMKGGGGAIMAMGRAGGEHRVQNAILDALNSPLLYGSDISKADHILFNIYTSSEYPLFVDEIDQIDAFMEELDPNIDVIWGMAEDDTLDEDAKITILATGFENCMWEKTEVNESVDDEERFAETIEMLYGRNRKGRVTYEPQSNVIEWVVGNDEEVSPVSPDETEAAEAPDSTEPLEAPDDVVAPDSEDTPEPPSVPEDPAKTFLKKVIARIKEGMRILVEEENHE